MKQIILVAVILGVMVIIAGCGDDPPGKYINEYVDGEYIQLNEGGSFTAMIKKKNYRGTYEVQGEQILFKFPEGEDRVKYDGKVIEDNDGNFWVKQK